MIAKAWYVCYAPDVLVNEQRRGRVMLKRRGVMLKRRGAVWLAQQAGRAMDRSFHHYSLGHSRRSSLWARLSRPLVKLALRADKECGAQQLIEEGWWG